jgi:hypothetical protein
MADTTQMNVNVLIVTNQRLDELARLTFRRKGDMVDYLVAEAYDRIKSQATGVMAEAVASETTPSISQ